MAIEKRTLPNGEIVGFDTAKGHYCNLPKDIPAKDIPQMKIAYDDLPFSDVEDEPEELQEEPKRRGRPKKGD